MMWVVVGALSPAVFAAIYERGAGVFLQVALAVFACLLFESLCLAWRRLPIYRTLQDGSAIIAALIIGLALPAGAPWFVAVAASGFAMVLAKHCYGGLGNNPFNPAMAGYALAFVSFPAEFEYWFSAGDWAASWQQVFQVATVDATSMPTPLAAGRLNVEFASPGYVFNIACVVGGVALLVLRIADWRLSVAFVVGAWVVCGFNVGELFTHVLAGGFLLTTFFVITDPATAATTRRGRWLYGAVAGALVIFLRDHGAHADGIAFAVLVCNMLAPLMDRVDKITRWS